MGIRRTCSGEVTMNDIFWGFVFVMCMRKSSQDSMPCQQQRQQDGYNRGRANPFHGDRVRPSEFEVNQSLALVRPLALEPFFCGAWLSSMSGWSMPRTSSQKNASQKTNGKLNLPGRSVK